MYKSVFLLISIAISLLSNTLIVEKDKQDFYTFPIEIYEDKTKSLSQEEIKLKNFKLTKNSISLGFSDSNFWFRFKIRNNTNRSINYILESTEVTAHELDCFIISNSSIEKIEKGMNRLNENGIIEIKNPQFKIVLNPLEEKEIYLRQYSLYPLFTSFRVLKENSLHSNEVTKTKYITFYLGAALILILYNFFIYVFTKSQPHIFYVGYVFFFALWQAQTHGYYPFDHYASTQAYYMSGSLIPIWIAFITLFTSSLLETKRLFPKIYKTLNYLVIFMFLLTIYSWFDLRSAFFLINIIGTFLMPFLLYLGFKSYFNGNKVAILYILAQLTFLILSTIFALMSKGYLEYNILTRHGIVIGSFVEIFFFSVALGYKLKLLEEERFSLIHNSEQRLQKKVEQRTKELEDQKKGFETFFEKSSDGISILNLKDNKIMVCNQKLVDILKYKSKNDLLDLHPSQLSPEFQPDGRESFEKAEEMIKLAMEKHGHQFEWNHIRANGEEFWTEITLTPMTLNNEVVLHNIWRDISDKKRNEELIINQTKMAALGEMIGNISHQWRQPLSVISVSASGLKLKKELGDVSDKEIFKFCDLIDNNAQYLSRTIDDFRDYIKGDSEKVEFNLSDNLKSFVHFIEGTIINYEINLIQEIEDTKIFGYPHELVQCYINIFNNAKDALEKIEGVKFIFLTSTIKNDKVVISFRDNAGGIDEHMILKVFEPYFTTKHRSQGTGLGLHMTYELIVNHMKGSIEAQNVNYEYKGTRYKGAEFKITLPLILN